MSKIKLRENLMKLVFQYITTKNSECDLDILELNNLTNEEKENLLNLFKNIVNKYDEIINLIEKNLINYKLERVCKTDLAILVVAIYELKFLNEDVKIVVNEAVELAKKYSQDNSYKFVNGLLAKVNNAV